MNIHDALEKNTTALDRIHLERSVLLGLPSTVEISSFNPPNLTLLADDRADAVAVAKLFVPVQLAFVETKTGKSIKPFDLLSTKTKDDENTFINSSILPWWWKHQAGQSFLCWTSRLSQTYVNIKVLIDKDPATTSVSGRAVSRYGQDVKTNPPIYNIYGAPNGDINRWATEGWFVFCYDEPNGFGLHEFLGVDRAEDEQRMYGQ